MFQGQSTWRSYIASRKDFFLYLYQIDKMHRNSVNGALIGFLIATAGLLLVPENNATYTFYEIAGLTLAIFSGLCALISVVVTVKNARRFDPSSNAEEFCAVACRELPVDGQPSIKLEDLCPSSADSALGFHAVIPNGSEEIAHTSKPLNSWLSTQPRISIDLRYGNKNRFTRRFRNDPHLNERLVYLRSLVRSKVARNEQKYRLCGIAVGNDRVVLEKVGYFDALMSNQLVTSQIMRRPIGTDQSGIEAYDLRNLFPMVTEIDTRGQPKLCLSELREDPLLANSVGVTTLALSRDNFPVIFNQKNHNIEGSGTLTLAGSGSADFRDILPEPRNQLLNAIKTGMVRELLEEAHTDINARELHSLRHKTLEKTYVTGFFRWIRRGGKPEFLGVTKLDINLANISADNIEVAPLLAAKDLRIMRMSDFKKMAENLVQNAGSTRKMEISLSSAMAIWRLAEIAADTTDEGIKLRAKIATLLDVEVD